MDDKDTYFTRAHSYWFPPKAQDWFSWAVITQQTREYPTRYFASFELASLAWTSEPLVQLPLEPSKKKESSHFDIGISIPLPHPFSQRTYKIAGHEGKTFHQIGFVSYNAV